jgi:hypothetical protein
MVNIIPVEHAGLAALELVEHGTRLVIVHEIGPRIAWFGSVAHENLLFWDDEGRHTHGDWRLYGGHRLWTTRPGADECEETYAPDNAACRVRALAAGVAVTAPPDAARLEKSIVVRARGTTWTIEHRLRNTGDMLWSGGAWALTCTVPERRTRYRIPLDGGDPRWDALTMVVPRRWGGNHRSRLVDPQFRLLEDALEIVARGDEAKRMLSTPRGTLEMRDGRGRLVISAARRRGGAYPLGTNVAIYLGPRRFMVELETMSPSVTLAPGDTLVHVEHWTFEPPSEDPERATSRSPRA